MLDEDSTGVFYNVEVKVVRIGVVGDTHGNLDGARRVIAAMGDIEMLLHTGDYYSDGLALAKKLDIPVKGVAGNCDRGVKGPEEEEVQVAGWRILLVHGHRYRVKFGYLNLFYRAQEVGADMVVFGHTHCAQAFSSGGIEFLNPGTAGSPTRAGELTGGIIEIGTRIEAWIIAVP